MNGRNMVNLVSCFVILMIFESLHCLHTWFGVNFYCFIFLIYQTGTKVDRKSDTLLGIHHGISTAICTVHSVSFKPQ